MKHLLDSNRKILMEAAVIERIRRSGKVQLHNSLVHAPLIYDPEGRLELISIFQEYVDIAKQAENQILLCTPTWRTNYSRVMASSIQQSVNIDAVNFLKDFRESQASFGKMIKLGGLIGCKNDCYKPEQGLAVDEAFAFHSWQVNQLVMGGIDYLIGETLPNVGEALGIAKSMEDKTVPYIISFVISRDGRVLDGTPLLDAVQYIDSNTSSSPTGYMVNCAHPSFIDPSKQPPELFARLIGYQANASALDHHELDDSDVLQTDSVAEWASLMLELNTKYGVKILGGCCGTTGKHLEYLVNNG